MVLGLVGLRTRRLGSVVVVVVVVAAVKANLLRDFVAVCRNCCMLPLVLTVGLFVLGLCHARWFLFLGPPSQSIKYHNYGRLTSRRKVILS